MADGLVHCVEKGGWYSTISIEHRWATKIGENKRENDKIQAKIERRAKTQENWQPNLSTVIL